MPAPQLLVMPQRDEREEHPCRWVRRSSDTGNTLTQTRDSLIRPVELVVASRIWYNRLIAASVWATNAPARWHLGDFKRAFQYRQIIPFAVTSAPLSEARTCGGTSSASG